MYKDLNTFEQGPIRPPAEADSLLIRTTRGCPWNRCHFCTLFKGVRFSIRSVDEIKNDIVSARLHFNGAPFETCFLQDGDSFAMQTKNLIEVLQALKEAFPSLKRISSYGRAQSMMRKSTTEIQEIRDAGLNMLYCGIESGSDKVLEAVHKGVTQDAIIQSALRAREAGMSIMVFVILGLGGKGLSELHIRETAHVLNTINPNSIRMMSLAVKQDTELGKQIANGSFTLLSETEMVTEQRQMIDRLDGIHSHYGNFHGINLLTEIDGVLPEDKAQILSVIDTFLSLGDSQQCNFILGKRLGYYSSVANFKTSAAYSFVQEKLEKIQKENPNSIEKIFHELRNRII